MIGAMVVIGAMASVGTLLLVQWSAPPKTTRGVLEREFSLEVDGRRVPGVLWTAAAPDTLVAQGSDPASRSARSLCAAGMPDAGGDARALVVPDARGGISAASGSTTVTRRPAPLVALGHGASNHKRQDAVMALARRLVRHHGFAALAIDGPVHGDRRADAGRDPRLSFLEFGQRWSLDGDAMTDAMVADWRAAIDAVQGLDDVGAGPLGWWGVSMGTILGLPVVAAVGTMAGCVLGLMGLTGPTKARIAADAARVRCPLLFLMQWDDELFPRSDSWALFDALASTDKRLHAHVGAHGALPAEALDASEAFLARALGTAGSGST